LLFSEELDFSASPTKLSPDCGLWPLCNFGLLPISTPASVCLGSSSRFIEPGTFFFLDRIFSFLHLIPASPSSRGSRPTSCTPCRLSVLGTSPDKDPIHVSSIFKEEGSPVRPDASGASYQVYLNVPYRLDPAAFPPSLFIPLISSGCFE